MKIPFDFSELWRQVRRITPDTEDMTIDVDVPITDVDVELHRGREVILEDLGVVNGLLSIDGRQILLYIPDQSAPLSDVVSSPEKGRRFHVAECSTLVEMRAKNRFERYIATNNLSGVFRISGKTSYGASAEADAELMVCKNCLKRLNYQNYVHGRGNPIWRNFDIGRFFETYSTCFRSLPRSLSQQPRLSGYTDDWSAVSGKLRQECGFVCDDCGVNLSSNKRLLHVHHVNGVKSDNRRENLRPLCIDCHRRQPMHDHIFILASDMQAITRLRREQGLVASGWEQALKLADSSVHGALMHARHNGFSAPEIGYEFTNAGGIVIGDVEAAWPDRRIAISIAQSPEMSGWRILDPAAFIESY